MTKSAEKATVTSNQMFKPINTEDEWVQFELKLKDDKELRGNLVIY